MALADPGSDCPGTMGEQSSMADDLDVLSLAGITHRSPFVHLLEHQNIFEMCTHGRYVCEVRRIPATRLAILAHEGQHLYFVRDESMCVCPCLRY